MEWLMDNAVMSIVSAIFVIIGAVFGGKAWGKTASKARVPVQEAVQVVMRIRKARKPTSPGGSKITDEEKDEILAEAADVIEAIVFEVTGQKIELGKVL